MSKIKLAKYTEEFGNIGINPDVDEKDKPFNRISLWVKNPITKENLRYEWNKADSGIILNEEDDGTYVETKDVEYYQKLWEANTYQDFLTFSTLIPPTEIDKYNIENNMAVPKSTKTYDEVYVNKKLVRSDYNIGLWQSDKLIEEVEKVFGKDQEWKKNRFNIIGTYQEHDDAPLRPPYTNVKTYSWYNVFTDVPEDILEEFKVPDVGYTYKEWNAIKYNTVTGKKQFKLVIADTEHTSNYQKHPNTFIPRPEVPVYAPSTFFFAKIFNQDGTEADEYDVFFTTTKDIMKEFCKEKNLNFPVPENREDDFIWIYGLVYDKKTLEIKQVKGYIRYPTDQGEWL